MLIFFHLSFWRNYYIFLLFLWCNPAYNWIYCAIGKSAGQIVWYRTCILCVRLGLQKCFLIFLLPGHFWRDYWTIIVAVVFTILIRLKTLFLQNMKLVRKFSGRNLLDRWCFEVEFFVAHDPSFHIYLLFQVFKRKNRHLLSDLAHRFV